MAHDAAVVTCIYLDSLLRRQHIYSYGIAINDIALAVRRGMSKQNQHLVVSIEL